MIHLVTGRQGKAHIKTSDMRSLNRAIFGNGYYRMRDIDNLNITVSKNDGYIIVNPGSFMWYGMQVKIDEPYYIKVTFSGTQNWRVVANYTKTATTGGDYVEEVTLTADTKTTELKNFTSDSDTTASVKIATLKTVSGVLSGSVTYIAQLPTEASLNVSVNDLISRLDKATAEVKLYEGVLDRGVPIALSESIMNFKRLMFVANFTVGDGTVRSRASGLSCIVQREGFIDPSDKDKNYFQISFPLLQINTESSKEVYRNYTYTACVEALNNGDRLNMYDNRYGGVKSSEGAGNTSVASSLNLPSVVIYGIGRV